jgi:hypothetical protein
MEKMYGLSFSRQSDGAIRLSQGAGAKESSFVLAPSQLSYIARRVAGLDESDSARVADLERKLGVLASRIEKIACDDNLRNDIAEHCRDGLWIISQLDGLLDLAVEFDGGRLLSGLWFAPKPEEINTELN